MRLHCLQNKLQQGQVSYRVHLTGTLMDLHDVVVGLNHSREPLIISPLDTVPPQYLEGDRHSFLYQPQVAAMAQPKEGSQSDH